MGFQDFGDFGHPRHPAIQTTGLLTFALAGLSPAEHTSVYWSQHPDLILSHHPARATARRLPPSTERRAPPGEPVGPTSAAMTHPLRSTTVTAASSLLRGSPSLSGASVLSASRFLRLCLFS
jgi:hypothetical protein